MGILKVSGILWAVIGCVVSIESTDWMNSLASWVAEESGFRQVTLATRLAEDEKVSSPRIEEFCARMMRKVPTIRLNIARGAETKNSSTLYNATDYFVRMDVTSSLFVMILESREILPILPSRRLIDYAAKLSVYQYRPTYLLLFVDRVPVDSLEDTLNYAWTKKMYDFTILELPEAEATKKRSLLAGNREFVHARAIVHQVNRFRNEYRRFEWTSGIVWFPNKVADMAGHPLRITAVDAPPFSIARFNEFRKPVMIDGPTVRVVQTIALTMNATLEYRPLQLKGSSRSNAARILHTSIKSNNIDLQSYLSPHYTATIRDRVLRTTSLLMDQWCPVVPIIPITRLPMSVNFLATYALSATIVMGFVLLPRLFRIESSSSMWRPLNIARVLLAIPVTCKPLLNVERIVFSCLILLSMIYSNNMYGSLTEISLKTDAEMDFETFEDLDRSGLIPVITTLTLNKTFDNPDPTFRSLRKKSTKAAFKMYLCPKFAADGGNITCLMSKREANTAIVSLQIRHGRRRIKIAKPCFWSDSRGFVVGPGSPYLRSFDRVIARMHDTGLIDNLYEYKYNNLSDFNDGDYYEKPIPTYKRNMIVLRQRLIAILSIGYLLSTLVLVAEILVGRCANVKRAVKRLHPSSYNAPC